MQHETSNSLSKLVLYLLTVRNIGESVKAVPQQLVQHSSVFA